VRTLLPVDVGEPDLESIYSLPPASAGRHLRLNFVTSLDGAIEVEGRSGPLGGPGDRLIFHELRGLTDVVLVGAGTVRAERYGPAALPERRQQARVRAGQRPTPPIAVVTSSGLAPDARLLSGGPGTERPLILTTERLARAAPAPLQERAELVACGDEQVDLAVALDALSERGLNRVLCEGGPSLATKLLAAGHVDELCLTLAPMLAGPNRAGLSSGTSWSTVVALALASVLEQDGDLFLLYRRPSG
jgi:riboflavin biosynthesis pyrimidine reductase